MCPRSFAPPPTKPTAKTYRFKAAPLLVAVRPVARAALHKAFSSNDSRAKFIAFFK